ncbi:MAG: nucleoside-diphosphate kinase [Proteobacteria bacterium]|nr:MAG: nucleoside-diphosphate kinase [Pseudomonadota bacterium]
MGVERTLAIIKPDAVAKNAVGAILKAIQDSGLRVIGLKMIQLTEQQARGFYAVHKARPFYGDLVRFMTSGPVVVAALEGEGAIARWRDLMGPTDATKAPKGTIRGDFGSDVERNASHGSDAPETARVELAYFFNAAEIQAPVEALP